MSQTDLHPQVKRGSLIHTLREDGDQNLKMFFFSALQALAYIVWIINKVRVQYRQASFLDLLLMDSINLLMFEENFSLLLISTFNPPWDYFLKLCSPVDRAKSIPDWPTEFQPVRKCQISVDTKEYHSLHCSLQHLNRFVFAEQNILCQNFQTSRSSSALKLQITFLKANVLFLNEKYFRKRRKLFLSKRKKTRNMDLKLLLIQSKEWLNYS